MTSPFVTILLATYNGARHLPEQLCSLAGQTRRPEKLVVRDDGSSDDSIGLVREWGTAVGIPVHVVPAGERLGPARSFLAALRAAGPADIYFFCDQDDVWLPEKVARAVDAVTATPADVPHLHATRLEIVDEHLQPLRAGYLPTELSFASAACESVLTGCTMAFNTALARLLSGDPPRFLIMHDWWAYLVATACGHVSYDARPSLLYRQHGANTLGASPQGLANLRARLASFLGSESVPRSLQLLELLRLHGNTLSAPAHRLAVMLTAGSRHPALRWRAALFAPIRRQSMSSTLSTRISLLTNRF